MRLMPVRKAASTCSDIWVTVGAAWTFAGRPRFLGAAWTLVLLPFGLPRFAAFFAGLALFLLPLGRPGPLFVFAIGILRLGCYLGENTNFAEDRT